MDTITELQSKIIENESLIEHLQRELDSVNFAQTIMLYVFIIAIVAIICFTIIRCAKIKRFGSSQQYREFLDWKHNYKQEDGRQ